MISSSLLVGLAAVVWTAQPGSDAPTTPEVVRIHDALVKVKWQTQIPAEVAGKLAQLALEDGTLVEEGMIVQAGQVLGQLDDADASARHGAAQLEHEVAKAEEQKARSTIEAAKATTDVAKAEVADSNWVNQRSPNAIAVTQLRRQELTVTRSKQEEDVAVKDHQVATLNIDLRGAQATVAKLNLDRHHIVSPLAGEVVQVLRQRGDWVQPGDPIYRVVHLDRLRIEGFVSSDEYLPEEVAGRQVTITVKLPRGRTATFAGQIGYVSQLVEASRHFRVWAEIENRQVQGFWVLRPGMEAVMEIHLGNKVAAN